MNTISFLALFVMLLPSNEALYLQAITSALSSIPATGTLATLGVGGLKMAIATSLLSYLGRRGSKNTEAQKVEEKAVLPEGPIGSYSSPPQAFYPYPLYGAGGMNSPQFAAGQSGAGMSALLQQTLAQQMMGQAGFEPGRGRKEESSSYMGLEEAEQFFTLLSETDVNGCISRLLCEIGANPETTGVLAETVNDIMSSLENFPEGSRAGHYFEIFQVGKSQGSSACTSKFSTCDDATFDMVKNVQASGEESPEVQDAQQN